jgi:hypothetical protein
MIKIKMKNNDVTDVSDHMKNLGVLNTDIDVLMRQRRKEVKALERVWDVVTLQAKLNGEIPKNTVVPKFLHQISLLTQVQIIDGIASFVGEKERALRDNRKRSNKRDTKTTRKKDSKATKKNDTKITPKVVTKDDTKKTTKAATKDDTKKTAKTITKDDTKTDEK